MYTVGIITSSDKGYAGERDDKCGPMIQQILEECTDSKYQIIEKMILPDEIAKIERHPSTAHNHGRYNRS